MAWCALFGFSDSRFSSLCSSTVEFGFDATRDVAARHGDKPALVLEPDKIWEVVYRDSVRQSLQILECDVWDIAVETAMGWHGYMMELGGWERKTEEA
jgi:hypothetical protein